MKNITIGIAVVIAIVVVGYYFYAKPVTQSAPDEEVMMGDVSSNMPVPGMDVPEMMVVKEFTVEGKNFSFTPATFSVKKGDTISITFKNTSGFHNFVIDEFGVRTQEINGGQETVEFVADKAGSFEYYCSVGQHRAMGMKGTLIVTE